MSASSRPPTFEEAKNRRQKVRSAGLDPNHWYAVEHSHALAKGKVIETKFWGTSVAVYRDDAGVVHAIENRCAHRQLKLTVGNVVGDKLVCAYHGWEYSGDGKLAAVPHDLFGHKLPACKLKSYPVRVRYGLIWVFFGAPERATTTPMPEIPELEGPAPWACVPVDFVWRAHHSMILDNVSDFTHAYLHRKYQPFSNDSKLTRLESTDDNVSLSYDTKVGYGKISGLFVDRKKVDTGSMDLAYEYPYQWSNTNDQIKHWLFVLPIDERTSRTFFLFYFKEFKVPFLPLHIPRRVTTPFLKISNKLLIEPLLRQDLVAVEAEQEGWEQHYDEPITELSPAVHAFQALTVRKWEEHLAREGKKKEGLVDASALAAGAAARRKPEDASPAALP
jgi:phenylpropionate dioxygenase-like ring-hydroxylating dioxygenase large terminal subunit